MGELRVRDHSQPCKHAAEPGTNPNIDYRFSHTMPPFTDALCPGGREIVFQQEQCWRPDAHPNKVECDGFVWVEVTDE